MPVAFPPASASLYLDCPSGDPSENPPLAFVLLSVEGDDRSHTGQHFLGDSSGHGVFLGLLGGCRSHQLSYEGATNDLKRGRHSSVELTRKGARDIMISVSFQS